MWNFFFLAVIATLASPTAADFLRAKSLEQVHWDKHRDQRDQRDRRDQNARELIETRAAPASASSSRE